MAETRKLTDLNGQSFYPLTNTESVIGSDGESIDAILEQVPINTQAITEESERAKASEESISSALSGEVARATQRENTIEQRLGNYILSSEKGSNNGVATLNGGRKVWNDQLAFAYRGEWQTSQDIDATDIEPGMYFLKGNVSWAEVLSGDGANGVLVQYPDNYHTQQLIVGRSANHPSGEQVETYTRRYLSGAKRWTEWSKGGGGTSDDIYVVHIRPVGSTYTLVEPVQEVFAARGAGKTLIGIVEGARMGGVLNYLSGNDALNVIPLACAYYVNVQTMQYDVYTIIDEGNVRIVKERVTFNLGKMTLDEAKDGNGTVERTISPSVLKSAILHHTSNLVNGGSYNSETKNIELKHNSTVLAEIDATEFIKDGMVDSVKIENGNLVISFNTDSGKEDISLALTDIFDPDNYYTKAQTDGLLSSKQDTIQDLAEIRAGAALGSTALQVENDPTVPEWAKQAQKPSYSTSELTNDGDGQSPFATEDYVEANGGKIDVIKYNGTPLEIVNKAVDILVPAPYDDTSVRELISAETARAQGVEAQLNTDINTQTGRINTAINDLETAKTEKIAEMDAEKVAAETATAAAIVATQNADAATQATQTAIAQAERVNAVLDPETNVVTITDKDGNENSVDLTNKTDVTLSGSTVIITDRVGNESEIDLLDATNERVYINISTNKPNMSVTNITVNVYYNKPNPLPSGVTPDVQVTTNENGQCYVDVPNDYHYRLVFPTLQGCDPITDVTHIAHASQRIIDVEYEETITPPSPVIVVNIVRCWCNIKKVIVSRRCKALK